MIADWKLDLMAKVIVESIWSDRKEAKNINEDYLSCGIAGNRKKPEFIDSAGKRRPLFQSSTGSTQ